MLEQVVREMGVDGYERGIFGDRRRKLGKSMHEVVHSVPGVSLNGVPNRRAILHVVLEANRPLAIPLIAFLLPSRTGLARECDCAIT